MDNDDDAGSIARRGWAALLAVLHAKGFITDDENLRIISQAHGLRQLGKVTPLRLVGKASDGGEADPAEPDPAA